MIEDPAERIARLERLRKMGLRRARDLPRPAPPERPRDESELPGEPVMTPFGEAWVRTERFSLAGDLDLARFRDASPATLAAIGQDPRLDALDPARAAYIDTETTGLSLGAGTYTFLIGVGQYEAPSEAYPVGSFAVSQFFMRSPQEEASQLYLVEEALRQTTGFVSFNGRAFDLPLVTNRFVLARMPVRFADRPHLDLLPAARRVWRARWQSCSLGSLEQNVLALQRSQDDVPGWMIPGIYRDYYRTGGGADMLARVFYHNLQDIVSMALLGARLAGLFQPDRLEETLTGLHPLECMSLARCYEALDWTDAGIAAYRMAHATLPDDDSRAAALRQLGFLYKRLGRQEDAAAVWEEWLSGLTGDDLTPYIELAKHHEWRTLDLEAARGWAGWALHIAERWPPGPARDDAIGDLQHRIARLERKLRDRETTPVSGESFDKA
jgi:uncharacterized protein YprB with RNaseH-like and TPR domain